MFIYCIGSDYTDKHGLKKLGCTEHPVERMRVYNTGDAPGIGLDKRYDALWEVSASSSVELRFIEHNLHCQFNKHRLSRNGNYTEWFRVSFELVEKYIESKEYTKGKVNSDELDSVNSKGREKAHDIDIRTIVSEDESIPLRDVFFTIFLEGKQPREVQVELWDKFACICDKNDNYRGIVQWSTGVGKTIGLLIMFLLSAEKCKKAGGIFRGLLIAPKNDIFNTIIHVLRKLKLFDITVCEGHNGSLSSVAIPKDRHVLITATHKSLINLSDKLPNINHIHYDETHRIVGPELVQVLKRKLQDWDTRFLTGTSATPITGGCRQFQALKDIFGGSINVIHECGIVEAVSLGYIANPRFGVRVIKRDTSLAMNVKNFIAIIRDTILDKVDKGIYRGGKTIVYLPSLEEVKMAVREAKVCMSEWELYSDQTMEGVLSDRKFVIAPPDGTVRILFVCQRYQEGSDIKGVEITARLLGQDNAIYIILQIIGRALRRDYEGKEGWCLLVRPCDEDKSEDEVLQSLILGITKFIGVKEILTRNEVKRVVETFFGSISTEKEGEFSHGRIYSVDETINRIHAIFVNMSFNAKKIPREKYNMIRNINRDISLKSRIGYRDSHSTHPRYIEDPPKYFASCWVSWYHFLGINCDDFPQTKSAWIKVCREQGFTTWSDYTERHDSHLPDNPADLYNDFTNWDQEMNVEEELIW